MSMIAYPIDFNGSNTFTQSHIDSVKKFLQKEAFPEFFNNNNFRTIQFDRFDIVLPDQIKSDLGYLAAFDVYGRTQQARKFGGTTDDENEDLDRSLEEFGVKFTTPTMACFTNDDEEFMIITGHRRHERFEKYRFTNRLIAVYKRKPGFTDDEIADELSQLGNIWNPKNLPSVPAKEYDIIDEGIRAVNKKWVTWDLTAIQNRLRPQTKAVGIGETKLAEYAVTVYNATNPTDNTKNSSSSTILPMGEDRANEWMSKSKYKDIEGKVYYLPLSYSTPLKNFSSIYLRASKEPDAIFRVVVHPGVLTSSDVKRQYDMRISSFYKKWHEIATAVAIVGNKGKPISFGNIELYGAIPVLGSHHDISSYTLNLFVKNSDGCYYQKGFSATPLDV